MAIHGFFKKPKTMKARILFLIFLFSSVFAFAQRRPDQFTEETSPTNANFEVYSQKNGQVRRASLLNLKKYFTPEVETAVINYVPSATGNTTNLMEFVKTAGDSIYFIDAVGASFLLHDPAAVGGGGSTELADGATIVGDGTIGNEFKNDTTDVIATKHDLYLRYYTNDSTFLKSRLDSLFLKAKPVEFYGQFIPDSEFSSGVNEATLERAIKNGGAIIFPPNQLFYVKQIDFNQGDTHWDMNGSEIIMESNVASTESVIDINKSKGLAQMSNVSIVNGTINGNRANQVNTGEMEGIDISNVRNFLLYKVTIKNCVSDALDADASGTGDNANMRIIDCNFIDNEGMANHLYATHNSFIYGNYYENNIINEIPAQATAAIDINANSSNLADISRNVIISNNIFKNNPTAFYNLGGDVLFADNIIDSCMATESVNGYAVLSSDTLTKVIDNTITTTSNDALNGQFGTIQDNRIYHAGGNGMTLNSSFAQFTGLVDNNFIFNSNGTGITASNLVVNLTNNRVVITGADGISLTSSTGGSRVKGGFIKHAGDDGLYSVGRTRVSNIEISECNDRGIDFTPAGTKKSVIRLVDIHDNGGLGINIGGDSTKVDNAFVTDNGSWGISAANGISLTNSIFERNTTFGGLLGSAIQDGLISDCIFKDNSGTNFQIDQNSNVPIRNVQVGQYTWSRGAQFRHVRTVTSNHTLDDLDQWINIDATSNSINITIGSLFSGFNNQTRVGRHVYLKRIDNSAFNVNILGAINGGVNLLLKNGETALVQITSTSRIDVSIFKDPDDVDNVYTSDGTLTGNRTVTLGTNSLTFQGIDGSNVNSSSFENDVNNFSITDGTNTSTLTQRADEIKIGTAPLKIVNDALDQIIITDNETNSTTKNGGVGLMHYTNTEQPVSYFYAQSGAAFSNLRIGGGSSDGNAATSIRFYTAANNTTTVGTNRMEIQDDGDIVIFSELVIDNTNNVRILSGTGTPEGNVTAGIGSTYSRTDGGAGTSFYVKESGTGNTGWVAK